MKLLCITLEPKSAFGTPLKGDTLFGQLCWTLLNRYGEDRLQQLLADYSVRPFAVCSDGFPSGYLPRPSLPGRYFVIPDGEDRKVIKKKRWIPLDELSKPISQWLENAKSDSELNGADNFHRAGEAKTLTKLDSNLSGNESQRPQPHNTINRLTGTTGEGMFAPYSQPQTWYRTDAKFDIYLLLDETRLPLPDVKTLFSDIGTFGYGRDASIGLGKFECINYVEWDFPIPEMANACLTLAPCAPQGLGLDGKHSYYNVFTRFGRHGDVGVHRQHGPFKAPILLADTAAVFSPMHAGQPYIGQGISGVSKAIPTTVHQGYAPYVPIYLPPKQETA